MVTIRRVVLAALLMFIASPTLAQISGGFLIGGGTPIAGTCSTGQFLYNNAGILGCQSGSGGGGVSSVSNSDGSLTISPTTGAVVASLNAAQAIKLSPSISGSSSTGAYGYGTLGYSDTNTFSAFQTSVNSYAQSIWQNSSNGATASTDLVLSNDLGTATTYYADLGINSSGFTGTGSLAKASATYLTATSGDLVLGTTTANAVHLLANNAATDAITISTANIPTLNSPVLVTPTLGTATANSVSLGSTGYIAWATHGQIYSIASNNIEFDTLGGSTYFDFTIAANNVLQLGVADAASPAAQTLQVQSVVAGTSNTAGAAMSVYGSKSTGTGTGGSINFYTSPAGTTGTSQNAGVLALSIDSTQSATISGGIKTGSATLHSTSVALTNGAASAVGTLTNAPVAGNPTKWVPINDNGTVRYIPAW